MSEPQQAEAVDAVELAEFRVWKARREACLHELKSLVETVQKWHAKLAKLKAEKERL